MDVSIIIVNYNTKELTSNCIDSIFNKVHSVSFEVILVDNASVDGSQAYFEKDKRIFFIASNENLGFGKANNLGYKYAQGRYILLLNSDTLLLNDAVTAFVKEMDRLPMEVGCIGCLLLDSKGNYMHSYGNFPSLYNEFGKLVGSYFPFLFRKIYLPSSNDLKKKKFKVDYVTGADLFIRKDVIEDCGLFDPDFFMYYEETELQYRYRQRGYYSMIVSTPLIIHLQDIGRKSRSLYRMIYPMESCFLFFKKCFLYWKYLLLRCLYLFFIPKIIIYPTNWSEKRKALNTLFKRK